MKNKLKKASVLLTALLLLAGCADTAPQVPEVFVQSAMVLTEEGEIKEYLVDDFAESYYSVSELEAMAKDEAKAYNDAQKASNLVVVNSAETFRGENGATKIRLAVTYKDANSFAKYNERIFFYGAVKDAAYLTAELGIPEGYEDNMVLVTDNPVLIYGTTKAEWISGGFPALEDGSVDLTQLATGKKAAIVFAK